MTAFVGLLCFKDFDSSEVSGVDVEVFERGASGR
jgi:hypothetical protein